MAHMSEISDALGALLTRLTGKTPQDSSWTKIRDRTVKMLRETNHARVNQFAVKESLDGLVEKFSVHNREDLAEALESRVQELPSESQWLPEILSLLLTLSDRPLEKTDLRNLDVLSASSTAQVELTWEDIIAADPVRDDEIWEDIEHGYHSSGDDSVADDDQLEPTVSSQATSVDPGDAQEIAKSFLVHPDNVSLSSICDHRRAWNKNSQKREKQTFSELAVVRETCMMLHGLPTDLYVLVGPTDAVSALKAATIDGISQNSLLNLLDECARDGTSLNYLRHWVRAPQRSAYMQSTQAAVRTALVHLDAQLGEIEMRHLAPSPNTVVSTLDLRTRVGGLMRPYVQMSYAIQMSSKGSQANINFPLLDALYDSLCIAQASGDGETLALLTSTFFAGLTTYTRLIASWANLGSLDSRDRDEFFVQDANVECGRGNLWHERFKMRHFNDGTSYAPKCLRSLANEIFALGKSKYLLLILDSGHDVGTGCQTPLLPVFECSRDLMSSNDMMPFSELLNASLRAWLTTSIVAHSPLVQSSLLDEQGLSRTLVALPNVFFAKDGSAFHDFAEGVFWNLTFHPRIELRGDAFMLTALAIESLGSSRGIDADSLSANINRGDDKHDAKSVLRTLGQLHLSYPFAWPIQNITRCRSSTTHAKVFGLLLQMYYAKSSLEKRFLDMRSVSRISSAALKTCQRLTSLVEIMQSHVATTAYALHKEMIISMRNAESVDAMVAIWASYEKNLQINLLVGTQMTPLQDAVINILEMCEPLTQAQGSARVNEIPPQLEKQLLFLIAGVQSIGRSVGGPWLEALAERLQWNAR